MTSFRFGISGYHFLLIAIIIGIGQESFVFGQETTAPAQLPEIEQLKAKLDTSAEGDTDQDRLREAIALLEQAKKNEAEADKFRDELATASQKTRQFKAQLESIPPRGATKLNLPPTGQSSAVDELLVEQRAELADLKNQIAQLEKEIAAHKARPDKVIARKMELQTQMAAAEKDLASPVTTAGEVAGELPISRILTMAKLRAAQVETSMLEQERLSFSVKSARLTAERDYLGRKIEFGEALLSDLVDWQNAQLQKEVSQVAISAQQAENESEGQNSTIKKLADELRELSDEFESITSERQKVAADLRETRFSLDEIDRDYDLLKAQLDIDGMSGVFGEVILEQSRNLPSLTKSRSRIKALRKQLSKARLGQFKIEESLRLDSAKEIGFLMDPLSRESDDSERAQISDLVTKQTEVEEQIKSEYQRLIRDLGDLELVEHQFAEKIAEVGAYLDEKRIWVRGSKVVGFETITNLPKAVSWLLNPMRLPEVPGAIRSAVISQPFLTILGTLFFAILLIGKGKLSPRLKSLGAKTRTTSADKYIYTVQALIITVVMALPLPLLFHLLGRLILQTPDLSDWLRGLGDSLIAASSPLFTVSLVRQLCRSDGLAEAHFVWAKTTIQSLRRNLSWIAAAYIPGLMIIAFTLSKEEMGHFDSLGRLSFLFMMGWTAFFIARLLKPDTGVFAERIRSNPKSMLAKLRPVWAPVVIFTPIAMGILAAVGYPLAAMALTKELHFTTEVIFAGIVFYSMLLRWSTMRVRRMTLEKHIAERQAEMQKVISSGGEESHDETAMGEMETRALNLAAVGDQTRRMLRFFAGVVVAITVWYSWSDFVPAFQSLDKINILGAITLKALIPALMIVIATVITARNLPGILEIFLQRFLALDPGSRFAATTIAQYIIVTIGFLFVFNTLGLDWSKFSWIAAALSVGLGFGMQEIVANFVCGIILLFERPIRIGDVVTVSGTTGTVTRIQIRATTITNWDRQEFVVPNKEIVTGSLLNWTLSNPLSRILITIGVAYGTDTRRVRELLYEIIEAQEGILEEPEPIVTFEEFADSSLNFSIRAYIPGLEKRLATLNDLNQAINDRFTAEGIEIPFPQRDLHIQNPGTAVES